MPKQGLGGSDETAALHPDSLVQSRTPTVPGKFVLDATVPMKNSEGVLSASVDLDDVPVRWDAYGTPVVRRVHTLAMPIVGRFPWPPFRVVRPPYGRAIGRHGFEEKHETRTCEPVALDGGHSGGPGRGGAPGAEPASTCCSRTIRKMRAFDVPPWYRIARSWLAGVQRPIPLTAGRTFRRQPLDFPGSRWRSR